MTGVQIGSLKPRQIYWFRQSTPKFKEPDRGIEKKARPRFYGNWEVIHGYKDHLLRTIIGWNACNLQVIRVGR